MATTSPDNIRTPDPGSSYNLVPDLAILAGDVQNALNFRANAATGTASQRVAFLSTAAPGMLWQDTDSIRMLWKRGVSAWEPAVWRWSGTTAQRNAFTQAPNGFVWHNTSTGVDDIRLGGSWYPRMQSGTTSTTSVSGNSNGELVISFPVAFPDFPMIAIQQAAPGTSNIMVAVRSVSSSGFTAQIRNFSSASYNVSVRWFATI